MRRPGYRPGRNWRCWLVIQTRRDYSQCGCKPRLGYKVPPQTHPTSEHVTVISGTFNIGTGDKFDEAAGKEVGAGGFIIMPPGMKHYAWTTADTIIQIHGTGPFVINYVNPTDDPRNAKK
jgi:hypothetical protein